MADFLEDISGEIGRVIDRAERMHKRHDAIEERLEDAHKHTSGVLTSLDELDGDITDVESGYSEVDSGSDDVSDGLDDTDSELGAFGKKKSSKAKKGNDKVKAATAKGTKAAKSAKSNVQTAKKSAVKAKAQVSEAKDESASLKAELAKQAADIKDIKTKFLSAEAKKQIIGAIEGEKSVTVQTVISTVFSLINAGAATATAVYNVNVPKDTYVESIKMRACPAVGAAATSIGVIVNSIVWAQGENILSGFNNSNAAVTSGVGNTSAIIQGKQILISDIAPTAVPINRMLKATESLAFSLTNISAVAADGVRLNVDIITRSAAVQQIMTV